MIRYDQQIRGRKILKTAAIPMRRRKTKAPDFAVVAQATGAIDAVTLQQCTYTMPTQFI